MSEKNSGSSLERLVLAQLRDPIRLRFALGVDPPRLLVLRILQPDERPDGPDLALTESERKRAATARQIEGLRKALAPFAERIPEHAGQNELVQYVMAHVRQSPVKLVDLKPTKTKDLGPFDDIGLRLKFEASYEDLDAFLAWVETDRRLLRVDSLKVEPTKDQRRAQCPARPAEPGGEGEGHRGREARGRRAKAGDSAMNTARLLKLAPTLIVVAVMAYAGVLDRPPGAARPRAAGRERPAGRRAEGRPAAAGPARRSAGRGARGGAETRSWCVGRPGQAGQARGRSRRGRRDARIDPYLAIVQGLTLNATFIQGKTQFASIDGRALRSGDSTWKGPATGPRPWSSPRLLPPRWSSRPTAAGTGSAIPNGFSDPGRSGRGRGRGRRAGAIPPAGPRSRARLDHAYPQGLTRARCPEMLMSNVFDNISAQPLILELLARRNWFEPRQIDEFEELLGKVRPRRPPRGGPDQGRLHLRPGDRRPLRRGPLPPPIAPPRRRAPRSTRSWPASCPRSSAPTS